MNNKMIILMESIDLMEKGVIKSTGEKIVVELPEGPKEYEIPEPIHTYSKWKELGYQVKRGSKAITQFCIWKYTSKKDKNMSEEEAQTKGYCFLKKASFFTGSQVEKIAAT